MIGPGRRRLVRRGRARPATRPTASRGAAKPSGPSRAGARANGSSRTAATRAYAWGRAAARERTSRAAAEQSIAMSGQFQAAPPSRGRRISSTPRRIRGMVDAVRVQAATAWARARRRRAASRRDGRGGRAARTERSPDCGAVEEHGTGSRGHGEDGASRSAGDPAALEELVAGAAAPRRRSHTETRGRRTGSPRAPSARSRRSSPLAARARAMPGD